MIFPQSTERCRRKKRLRIICLSVPYQISGVGRSGEKAARESEFWTQTARYSPEVCAKSAWLLDFRARSEAAENILHDKTGGRDGIRILGTESILESCNFNHLGSAGSCRQENVRPLRSITDANAAEIEVRRFLGSTSAPWVSQTRSRSSRILLLTRSRRLGRERLISASDPKRRLFAEAVSGGGQIRSISRHPHLRSPGPC